MSEFPAILSSNDDTEQQSSTNTEVLEACAEAVVAQSVGKIAMLRISGGSVGRALDWDPIIFGSSCTASRVTVLFP